MAYDRADWLREIANLRNNYLGPRVATTLAQLKVDGEQFTLFVGRQGQGPPPGNGPGNGDS